MIEVEEIGVEEIGWIIACVLFFFTGWLTGKGKLFDFKLTIGRNKHMNSIDEMPPKCKSCPYWEYAEYPYFCDCKERYENNDIPDSSQSEEENY